MVLCVYADDGDDVCSEGEVRLVGGHSAQEGQIQICHHGQWYSLCADGWTSSGSEARVICSQLGYSGGDGDSIIGKNIILRRRIMYVIFLADFGREMARLIPPLDVQCNGSELALSNCNITSRNPMDHCSNVAGVICGGMAVHQPCYFSFFFCSHAWDAGVPVTCALLGPWSPGTP